MLSCRLLQARGRFPLLLLPFRRPSSDLAGSAPSYQAQLVLHSGQSQEAWPKQIDDISPVHAEVCKLAAPGQKLEGVGIGFSARRSGHKSAPDQGETLSATLYPGMHDIPFPVTAAAIPKLADYVAEEVAKQSKLELVAPGETKETHIYVCTHGARDCRCGEVGGRLYEALQSEVRRRRLTDVHICQIAHIGGHKWAGNAIVYPSGDWYGLLRPEDASDLLDATLKPSSSSVWWSRWRGRTGLSQLEMKALYAAASTVPSGDVGEMASAIRRDRRQATALGDPIEVKFRRYDGEVVEARGFDGERLMDVAKRYELVEGTCGGFCECATCAVDLKGDTLPAGLAPPSEEEEDQLFYALTRTDNTRLACQVPLNAAFAAWQQQGGIVQLPRF